MLYGLICELCFVAIYFILSYAFISYTSRNETGDYRGYNFMILPIVFIVMSIIGTILLYILYIFNNDTKIFFECSLMSSAICILLVITFMMLGRKSV